MTSGGRRDNISARPEQTGGLSKATRQIAGLLKELTSTVESAEQLTRMGEPERALRLVDEQRESLYNTVESISRNVSAKRSRFEKLRTRTPILVAAALMTVSGLAISVAALTSLGAPQQAQTRLRQAERIADPATRLTAIDAAYREVVRTNPAAVAPGTALNRDVTKALTKTKTDAQGDPTQTALVNQATALINAVSQGQTPSPPPTPAPTPPPTPAPPGGSVPGGLPPVLPH
jgi:hypothetical protein